MSRFYAPFLVCLLFQYLPSTLHAQYQWDHRDPNDLNVIDLGDNKLLLYNAIALGLTLIFSDHNSEDVASFFTTSAEFVGEYRKEPLSQFYSINLRKGRKIRKRIWAGIEIKSSYIDDEDRGLLSLGFSPFFSWNIVSKKNFRLSYDNGVGPVLFSSAFPLEGTSFNFYTFYGLQLETKINNHPIALGIRNTHISNAEIKGKERNPSFDGVGFYLAWRL